MSVFATSKDARRRHRTQTAAFYVLGVVTLLLVPDAGVAPTDTAMLRFLSASDPDLAALLIQPSRLWEQALQRSLAGGVVSAEIAAQRAERSLAGGVDLLDVPQRDHAAVALADPVDLDVPEGVRVEPGLLQQQHERRGTAVQDRQLRLFKHLVGLAGRLRPGPGARLVLGRPARPQ